MNGDLRKKNEGITCKGWSCKSAGPGCKVVGFVGDESKHQLPKQLQVQLHIPKWDTIYICAI